MITSKKLRIVLLPDEYLPHGTRVHAKMMHELAKQFVDSGHAVVVVTPGTKEQKDRLCTAFIDGVEVWYFRTPPMRGVGFIRRAVTESLLSIRAWLATKKKLETTKFDICINYSPTIFFSLYAYLLKRQKAFIYLILRDFFPQWLVDQGKIRRTSIVYLYFRLVEIFNYWSADVVALQSPENQRIFAKKNKLFENKTTVLYNWVKLPEKLECELSDVDCFFTAAEGKTVFFYGGNMGLAQDMGNLINLAQKMADRGDAHFLFIGDGNEVQLVIKASETLKNVSYFPSVSQEVFTKILKRVDIGLFTLAREHTAHNFPGKLLGYMVNEIPILGSVNPQNDLQSVIENAGAGIVRVNGDDAGLLKAAITLLEQPNLRKKMGQNALILRNTLFSVESVVEDIIKKYETEENCH